jgi:ABC-type lipoprotein export system ATPase subunit/GNAT superfamily N-acetyltransferase
MANIELKSKIINDKYTEYIYNSYDIQNKDETIVNIPMYIDSLNTFNWNIGVILGNSGSGKSTILKSIGNIKNIAFDYEKPLISNFDWLEPKDATYLLTSMGLSSVPTWLRPFHTLSNGEQYRATLAYLVASARDGEIILIDEYTSVVDRDVAKAMSFALQKYIRKENKKIILASCHYDILEWLMPDWTCSPQKGGVLEKCDYLRQGRPKIELSISRVKPDTWEIFKKHHYLTQDVNKSYIFLLFEFNSKPIAINVLGIHVGKTNCFKSYRESRIVVLPDYQGLGIGSKISEFCAGIIKNNNWNYYTKTSNPALGEYRNKNTLNWQPTGHNGKGRNEIIGLNNKYKILRKNISYCHKYIGESISGYDELLLPINEIRNRHILTLF